MLDRIAVVTIALAALFLAVAIPAPFFLATMCGSVLLLWRCKITGRRELAVCAIVMPLFCLLRAPLAGIITAASPHTIDAALLRLECGIGPRFYAWVLAHHWCLRGLYLSYYWALPFGLSAVMAFADDALAMLKRCILAVILAVPFLLLFPAVGPVWVGTPTAPHNCLPSLHFTWALLAWYYSPRWLRWPSALLVILTGFATIGLGEHYLIDLIAAVPFTVAVVAIPLRFKLPTFGGAHELLDRV